MYEIGTGRRPLDLHTSFDRAKRLGSGNPIIIPPFVLLFFCSAWGGFETRCRVDKVVEMGATGISSSLVQYLDKPKDNVPNCARSVILPSQFLFRPSARSL